MHCVKSDSCPFESFVNIGTFPVQIAILELCANIITFIVRACSCSVNSSRDIIK